MVTVHNQPSLFEEVTVPSDKGTGYYDGKTDVRQDFKSDRSEAISFSKCTAAALELDRDYG